MFGVILLNGAWLRALADAEGQKVIINTTSDNAYRGVPSMGLYSTGLPPPATPALSVGKEGRSSGKAARESFMRVVATEYPAIRVLNYSPGPVETDMLALLHGSAHKPLADWLKGRLHSSSSPLPTLPTNGSRSGGERGGADAFCDGGGAAEAAGRERLAQWGSYGRL